MLQPHFQVHVEQSVLCDIILILSCIVLINQSISQSLHWATKGRKVSYKSQQNTIQIQITICNAPTVLPQYRC